MTQAIESRYGPVENVYGGGATTLAGWMSAEPGRTSGLVPTGAFPIDAPVYALFFSGKFTVIGPMTANGQASNSFSAGRIVFGADGEVLSVGLWAEPKPSDPAFGGTLDDA